jgi:hypothetical protein
MTSHALLFETDALLFHEPTKFTGQWFGLLEAINTVYLLGQHPDSICGEWIKNGQRSFEPHVSGDMIEMADNSMDIDDPVSAD